MEWTAVSTGGGHGSHSDLTWRPYCYWNHAKRLLEADEKTTLHYLDSISSIKRAVDCRLKNFTDLYRLKKLPSCMRRDGALKQLEYLNVIRPRMVKEIYDLRNALEHQFAEPPAHVRCLDYLDFSWYFLKSTDEWVRIINSGYMLIKDYQPYEDSQYWVSVQTTPLKSWDITLNGWIPQNILSVQEDADALVIQCEKACTAEERLSHLRLQQKEFNDDAYYLSKSPQDVWFAGRLLSPTPQDIETLYLYYFNAI